MLGLCSTDYVSNNLTITMLSTISLQQQIQSQAFDALSYATHYATIVHCDSTAKLWRHLSGMHVMQWLLKVHQNRITPSRDI